MRVGHRQKLGGRATRRHLPSENTATAIPFVTSVPRFHIQVPRGKCVTVSQVLIAREQVNPNTHTASNGALNSSQCSDTRMFFVQLICGLVEFFGWDPRKIMGWHVNYI